jgi:peptidoglycan/xylan/chitin deacetylase (PgdA/CDA1 family)
MDIKGLAATALNRLGFLDAYSFLRRKLTRSQVAILIYHRVCPDRDSWSLEPLSPQEFQKQIEYFCRNYELLSLDQLVSYIRQRKTLPEKAVVITFDDGYKDNYRYAYPLLKKYRIPATIFLATGCIGKDRLFWWDKVGYIIENSTVARLNLDELGSYSLRSNTDRHQAKFIISERLKNLPDGRKNVLIEKLTNICQVSIPPGLGKEFVLSWNEVREMSDDGISFGAHSVNHPILTNMPFERAKWEIVQSKKDIEERLGIQVTTFAYPNGNYDSKLHQFLKECGFTCAVSVLPRKLIGLKDDPYSLSRIPAMEDSNKMKGMFCGLWGDLQGMLS